MGMCWAESCAASTTSLPSNASISSWQNARVAGSSLLTAVLVNAGSSSLRASWWNGGRGGEGGSSRLRGAWWNGGSEEIGGAVPIGSISLGGRKLLMMIEREVKFSVS